MGEFKQEAEDWGKKSVHLHALHAILFKYYLQVLSTIYYYIQTRCPIFVFPDHRVFTGINQAH